MPLDISSQMEHDLQCQEGKSSVKHIQPPQSSPTLDFAPSLFLCTRGTLQEVMLVLVTTSLNLEI